VIRSVAGPSGRKQKKREKQTAQTLAIPIRGALPAVSDVLLGGAGVPVELIEISDRESNEPLFSSLLAPLEGWAPLAWLVVDYVGCPLPPTGPSFFDLGHPWRRKTIPAELRLPIGRALGLETRIADLLARDLVSVVEITGDCNSMGHEYLRAYFRFRRDSSYPMRMGMQTLSPTHLYEVVPYGCHEHARDPNKALSCPPFVVAALTNRRTSAVYRTSSGALFDLAKRGKYQAIFTRRSSVYG
jgi:hypothetical protein